MLWLSFDFLDGLDFESGSEVSGNFSSSPGDDDVIVLVDGEGVISFVVVEDLHEVSVATNTVSGAALGDSEGFNRLCSGGGDFGGLEEFDGFHGWFPFPYVYSMTYS